MTIIVLYCPWSDHTQVSMLEYAKSDIHRRASEPNCIQLHGGMMRRETMSGDDGDGPI